MIPTKVKRQNPLTTYLTVGASPAIPVQSRREAAELTRKPQYVHPAAARSGGLPDIPDRLNISDDFKPAAGVYLLAAPTGAGKTILSMSLVDWANAEGVPATYIYCFEPRRPLWTAGKRRVFKDPDKFIADAKTVITTGSAPKLVVFDSVTLPIKAWASVPAWRHQSTFQGGMQPSDRGFIDEMMDVTGDTNTCAVLVINSTLVPYVTALSGGAEGIILIRDVGSFSYSDRTSASKRRRKEISIPVQYVDAALDYFKFGTFNQAKTHVWKRGFSGI